MAELNYRDKKILGLLNKARNGDLEAFAEAYAFGLDPEKFSVKIENGVIHLNGSVEPFDIELKSIFDFDEAFYRDCMCLTEADLEIPAPEPEIPENMKVICSKIDKNTESLQKIVSTVQDTIIEVSKKIKDELYTQNDVLLKEIKSIISEHVSAPGISASTPDPELLEEIVRLKKENEDLLIENDLLKEVDEDADNSEISEEVIALQNKIDELTKEKDRLYQLAYYDTKCGVKNNNALNEKLKTLPKGAVVAEVSICGTKSINDKLGFKTGDVMIKIVSEDLKSRYSADNVYRVNGDVFFVLSEDSDVTSVYEKLAQMRDSLTSKELKIVFDVRAYAGSSSIAELEQSIKMLKTAPTPRPINIADTSDDNDDEEDDGYREEDSEELFSSYRKGN